MLADVGNRDEDAPGLRALPAERRLPRGRVQARADDGGEPARGGRATTCWRRRCVAEVAIEFGAERFVLISTDKALNAQAVYGQSKAVCEWIVEAYGAREDVSTRFVAVRFGNVLDSAGQRDPDLQAPDRQGRAGDGHASGDDALLHDDSRRRCRSSSRPARSAAAARSSSSTWASR